MFNNLSESQKKALQKLIDESLYPFNQLSESQKKAMQKAIDESL